MKILFVQNRFYPAIGGAETHVYLLSKYLAKKGHEVVVYTTNSLSNRDVTSFSLVPPFVRRGENKKDLPCEENLNGVRVKRFDFKFRYWSFNWVPDMFKELRESVEDFDIIHAHGYHVSTSLVSCYYAKKRNKPFILTAHDLIIPDDLPLDAKLLKRVYDKTFGKFLLKNSDRLIALTEDHIQQYIERGCEPPKIRIVPNAIELDKYKNESSNQNTLDKYGIDKKDKVLLFVGRIDKYKGVQDIIEVMPAISAEYTDVKFIVVGRDYGYREELEKLSDKLNVWDKVIFTGNVPENELIELYRRADIFILPSKMEGFGIVLLEAMASGTLCIAYSIPSVRKVIIDKKNGILVKDREELLRNILYYLENIHERKMIEKNALEYVRNYDIENIVRDIEVIYKESI